MVSVAIVGARQRRQGIGEYIAKYFTRFGADVRAIVGTSPETVAEAAHNLAVRYGIQCRQYT